MKKIAKKEIIILILILAYSLFVRTINLHSLPFGSAWDEGYYAKATKNILEEKTNLLFPDIGTGEIRLGKPPIFIWLGAISIKLFNIDEFNYRILSVIIGCLSILAFYFLIKHQFNKKIAIISSIILSSLPLHIVFSRIYQVEILVLLITIISSIVIIKSADKFNPKSICLISILIIINWYIKTISGLITIAGVFLFVILTRFKHNKKVIIKTSIYFIILIIIINFTYNLLSISILNINIENQTSLETAIGFNYEKKFFPKYYDFKTITPFQKLTDFSIIHLGHFFQENIFTKIHLFFLLIGTLIITYKSFIYFIHRNKTEEKHLFWMIWLIFFLPFQFGKNHFMQYYVILTPFFSITIGIAIYFIFKQLLKIKNKIINYSVITIFILILIIIIINPFKLIFESNEILYQTHYDKIGKYINNKTEGYNYSIIARYYPGMFYYTEKPPISTDYLRKSLQEYVTNKEVRFVEIKTDERDNPLNQKDIIWFKEECTNIDKEANIPEDSIHHLYDCE
ncbi:glycosyltransferase family 39 protein [Candidatus Woesearchaeota archaeon]|nr:glycosyltransferase family 39 protein [Candidatus Woesearchaeota archaeon]